MNEAQRIQSNLSRTPCNVAVPEHAPVLREERRAFSLFARVTAEHLLYSESITTLLFESLFSHDIKHIGKHGCFILTRFG